MVIAKKAKTLKNFRQDYPNAYKAYLTRGKPEEATKELKTDRVKWTKETALSVAKTFSDRWSFQKGNGGAYRFLWKAGLLDEVFPAITTTKWDKENVAEVAKSCQHRHDLRVKHPGAYKFAYKNNLLKGLFGETKNIPNCDDNVLYIWAVKGVPNLYKIGVTSRRLRASRIKYSCRKGGLKASQIWVFYINNAKETEKTLLSLGTPYKFDSPFSGHTEFRVLTQEELQLCLDMAKKEEEDD